MAKSSRLKSKVVMIEIVVAGVVTSEHVTEKVLFAVEDKRGRQACVESIVLDTQYLYTKGGEIDLLIGTWMYPQLHHHSGVYVDEGGLCIVEKRFDPRLGGSLRYYPKGNYENTPFNVPYINMKKEVNLWSFQKAETADVSKDRPCQLKKD